MILTYCGYCIDLQWVLSKELTSAFKRRDLSRRAPATFETSGSDWKARNQQASVVLYDINIVFMKNSGLDIRYIFVLSKCDHSSTRNRMVIW